MYTLYIKEHRRMAFHKKEIALSFALDFLNNHPYGVVQDSFGNLYYTEEELKNAQSIRPNSGTEFNFSVTSGGTLPEASDRELHQSTKVPERKTTNTESSTECDNQWD